MSKQFLLEFELQFSVELFYSSVSKWCKSRKKRNRNIVFPKHLMLLRGVKHLKYHVSKKQQQQISTSQ